MRDHDHKPQLNWNALAEERYCCSAGSNGSPREGFYYGITPVERLPWIRCLIHWRRYMQGMARFVTILMVLKVFTTKFSSNPGPFCDKSLNGETQDCSSPSRSCVASCKIFRKYSVSTKFQVIWTKKVKFIGLPVGQRIFSAAEALAFCMFLF